MVIKFEIEHTIKTGQEANALELFRGMRRNGSENTIDTFYKNLLITEDQLDQEANNYCIDDGVHFGHVRAVMDGPARIRLRLSA